MKRTIQLCKPALTPNQAMAQFDREARQRAPGTLNYETYVPALHNPDYIGYRQGIRPIAMTGVKWITFKIPEISDRQRVFYPIN